VAARAGYYGQNAIAPPLVNAAAPCPVQPTLSAPPVLVVALAVEPVPTATAKA
jgi:hypothetical protein